MKIVVLEAASLGKDLSWDVLKIFGELKLYENTPTEKIAKRVLDADIIVPNKCFIGESTIKEAKKIKIICEAATGYNNIDIPYCKKRGILVTNVEGYSTDSVAQHTFALFFYLYEKLSYYHHFVQSKAYSKGTSFTHLEVPFHELAGKQWGIIGLGNIGRKVAEIAEAFGCKVVCYSASGNRYETKYCQLSWEEFLAACDIISIHAPLNENTEHLIHYESLCKMKSSAILLNVGRGPIVKTEDLVKALKENKIAGAGLDVFETEPLLENSPILFIKDDMKLVMTPHIAWGTVEARERLIQSVANNIQSFLDGNPRNIVG